MSVNYERELSIRRAKALLDGGYDEDYVLKKLVKDGLSQGDAATVLQTLTRKALKIPKSAIEQPLILDDLSQNPFPVQQAAPSQKPPLSQNLDSETARRDATRTAIALLDNGYRLNDVHERLIQQGYSKATVNEALSRLASQKQAGATQYKRSMEAIAKERDDEHEKREKQRITGWLMLVVGIVVGLFALQYEDADAGTFLSILAMIITGIYRIAKSSLD